MKLETGLCGTRSLEHQRVGACATLLIEILIKILRQVDGVDDAWGAGNEEDAALGARWVFLGGADPVPGNLGPELGLGREGEAGVSGPAVEVLC